MQKLKEKLTFSSASFASLLRRMLYIFALIAVMSFALYVFSSLKQEREILLSEIANQAEFTAANSQAFFDDIGHSLELAALQVSDKHGLETRRDLFDKILKRHPEIAFIAGFDVDGLRLFTTFTDTSLGSIDKSLVSPETLPRRFADNIVSMRESMNDSSPYTVGRNEFGKIIQQWRIPVRYDKRTADGKLDFMIQASIPLSRQTSLWSNLGLLPNTRIGLYRDDGFVQTRWPDSDLDPQLVYGINEPPQSPMEEVVKAKRIKGYYEGPNSINHDYRIGAYSRLAHLPLTAFVSIPQTLVYQNWWQHNYALTITFVILFFAFLGFARLLLKLEKRHSTHLSIQANTDALTELPNRQASENYLNQRIAAYPNNKEPFAVLFLDLDEFKYVNDRFGHRYGDLVLKYLALRLKSQIRAGDLLARLGGDEFLAIIECDTQAESDIQEQVKKAVFHMLNKMDEPIVIKKHLFKISLSVGISIFPKDGINAQELLRKSDIAMYSVKNTNRNGYAFFKDEMDYEMPIVDPLRP